MYLAKYSEELLDLFLSRPGDYISGEEISQRMNISRTAVWKQINKLREAGYTFEAVSRKGYLLLNRPPRIETIEFMRNLKTEWMGRSLKIIEVTDSTQEEVRRLEQEGAPEGALVISEEQTVGRGRLGRKWFSPPGMGLWMSLLLKPELPLYAAPQLTLLTAVAVCRAIRSMCAVEVGIKWPNDLLIGGRKVCGILLESVAEDERIRYCIAGIGIDVNLGEENLPEELQEVMTSLKIETGQEIDRTKLAAAVMNEMESLYKLYLGEGFSPIAGLWEALSVSLNRNLSVMTPRGEVHGFAVSLDSSGALVLEDEQGKKFKVFSGDVQVRGCKS